MKFGAQVLEMFVYQGAGYDYARPKVKFYPIPLFLETAFNLNLWLWFCEAKGEYRISDAAESAESSKA